MSVRFLEHRLLVDTVVMVDFLRDRPLAVDFVSRHADQIILSTVVVAELYAGLKDDEEEKALRDCTALFIILPVTDEIARQGGRLKHQYSRSHGMGLADALIAATALIEGAHMATLNIKHYPMFPDLEPAYGSK